MGCIQLSWTVLLLVVASSANAQNQPQECLKQQVSDENRVFMDESGQMQTCEPEGFVYEARHCGCTSLIGGAPLTGRDPDVEITFFNGSVVDTKNRIWVNNSGVTVLSQVLGSVDGFVGNFPGSFPSQHLELPFFDNLELGAQIRIEIRFLEKGFNNARTTALLSDASRLGDGALFIGLNMIALFPGMTTTARLFIDTGVHTVIEHDIPSGSWKTLIVDYDAVNADPTLTFSVTTDDGEGFTMSANNTGNIRVQQSPMIIGAASTGQASFQGYMDHIKIWKSGFR